MTDLYLKTPTEAEMTAALLKAGIVTEQTVETQVGETEDGNAILQDVTVLVPTQDFSVDQIGPFTRDDVDYPDWHTNLRGSFDEEQLALLTPLSVVPPIPYRTWA